MTGTPRRRASAITGACAGTPGDFTTAATAVELRQAVRPRHRRDAVRDLRRAGVDDEHLLALGQQRARGGHAGACEADHEVGAARERRSHVIEAW